ncbi:uncharacterized protein LOC119670938 isoform X2 [Teleopsis dalmanni]|uniref:uncharacterized protein LOC119670938 isoform X2 n=1 Tax=Teleopsis dalmanni TaxID=139649 RepID=UPI0018CFB130|nr:uncharacterized protein LOC119670938 isoform X2 [Teleopsis dalmanni]
MFSFHKPRVYRSAEGCCICRAKSSSSRFTDSGKYESGLMKCFDLKYPRQGEICNACVLLVKRYKRLPAGSNRHWGHVVDARAGPGTKSLTKQKKSKDEDMPSTSNISSKQAHKNNSLIPERFAKIFKKNKKSKIISSPKKEMNKRKTTTNQWEHHSLPTSPDSVDSDYEDSRMESATASNVQFQTQTRASSYRTRSNTINLNLSTKRTGSNRRKSMPPIKNRRQIDNVQFFDETHWEERRSCCGLFYECKDLASSVIVDVLHYRQCLEHRNMHTENNIQTKMQQQQQQQQQQNKTNMSTNVLQIMPLSTVTKVPTQNTNPTPVLKKHHLFFKRQSESFPHADINFINLNENTKMNLKTEATAALATSPMEICVTTQAATKTTTANIPVNSAIAINSINSINSINVTNTAISTSNQMPKHSIAKTTTQAQVKTQNYLHKTKCDTGKIVKHSVDKINTGVHIKPSDLQDMRHIIKTVDKSYVLAKGNHNSQYAQPLTTSTATGVATNATNSPSTSPATKFSDNSSDSGFDENIQDRKSASPLQEEIEKKLIARSTGCVQTMFLASGVHLKGQPQNLVLAANETAAKILQTRKQYQMNRNNVAIGSQTVSTVKMPQATTTTNPTHTKLRTIYHNNSAIQHENGVTTIVPASSLAATSQTAAMNALAPSTVTITPAPHPHHQQHIGANIAVTNIYNKKLKATNAQTNSNTNLSSGSNNISLSSGSVNAITGNVSSLNQKIILVKSATKYNNNLSNISAVAGATSATITTLPLNNHSICKN